MTGRGFPMALLGGLAVAGAVAAGAFLSIVLASIVDDTGILLAVAAFGVGLPALMGSGVLGAVTGLGASRWAQQSAQGAGAGALAGLVGHFVVLVTVLLAFGIGAGIVGAEAPGGGVADEAPVSWDGFGTMLLFAFPAAAAGAVAGAMPAPAADAARPVMGHAMAAPAVASTVSWNEPQVQARRLTCRSCNTVNRVEAVPGRAFQCTGCGKAGRVPS